jgi:hypothetical protein
MEHNTGANEGKGDALTTTLAQDQPPRASSRVVDDTISRVPTPLLDPQDRNTGSRGRQRERTPHTGQRYGIPLPSGTEGIFF